MKKLILLFLGLGIALTSCSSDDDRSFIDDVEDDTKTKLSISSSSPHTTIAPDGKSGIVTFRSAGGESEITVDTDQRTLTAKSSEEWLKVECVANIVTLAADQNLSNKKLTSTVTIKAGSGKTAETAEITVTQSVVGSADIEVDNDQIKLTAGGKYPQTVIVTTDNENWDVEVSSLWLLAEKTDDNTLLLTADPNPNTSERVVTVDLVSTSGSITENKTIYVTQESKSSIEFSITHLSYDMNGGVAKMVTITTNQDDFEIVDSSDKWYTATKSADNEITVSANANSLKENRVGKIGIMVGKLDNLTTEYITLTQLGNDPDLLVFEVATDYDNNYVSLPLAGTLDCVVDWGDGVIENITVARPSHMYKTSGIYFPSVKGTVTSMNATGIIAAEAGRIKKVLSWGKTGLVLMEKAFLNASNLASIPGDKNNSFEKVINFFSAFDGCNNLVAIPEDLFVNCTRTTTFANVFRNCYIIKTIPPKLFEKCTEVLNFGAAFLYIYNLEAIPAGLFDNCPKVTSFNLTFQTSAAEGKQSKITSIPAGLFDKCPNVTVFSNVFYNLINITSIPSGLFDKQTDVTTFEYAFFGCTKLKTIPENLFTNNTKVTSFFNVFGSCTALTTLPTNLFNSAALTEAKNLFVECKSLTTIPSELLSKLPNLTNAYALFKGCTNLTAIPATLFDANPKLKITDELFAGCTSLVTFPATLFSTNVALYNLNRMFQDCKGLTTIPEGFLGGNTYAAANSAATMFKGCIGLKSLPEAFFAGCSKLYNVSFMFQNCSGLTSLPTNLFDLSKEISNFESTFSGCVSLAGKSPYGMVSDVEVPYYKRSSSANGYNKPYTTTSCFKGATLLTDYESIPTTWK